MIDGGRFYNGKDWPPVGQYQLDRMTDEERAGFAPLESTPAPWYDGATQRMEEGRPERDAKQGVYRQVWDVIPLEPEEREARAAATRVELQALAQAELNRTDYWAMVDRRPMTNEERAYREALRNVVRGKLDALPELPN